MVQKMIMARHIEVCRRLYNKDNRSIKLWILLGSELIQYEFSTCHNASEASNTATLYPAKRL